MKYILTFTLIALTYVLKAQEFNKSINKDSLLNVLVKDLPAETKADILKEYKSDSEKDKEFLLFILSMPRSSKSLQIRNIDSNYANISNLKAEYLKLVPSNTAVRIEFTPANANFNIKESIDLRITSTANDEIKVSQEWKLEYGSKKLKEMLQSIKWNDKTLNKIRKLLDSANCISIENGKITEIGFARSGMGMYSYLLFDRDLSDKQIAAYNNGCEYIFYKKNIVLEYGGGAAGPQCFPDR